MNTLPLHLVSYLTEFLPPIDLLSFTRTCTSYRKLYQRFQQRFEAGVLAKLHRGKEILSSIRNNAAFISGSILLQVLYDIEWTDSDVDVFGEFDEEMLTRSKAGNQFASESVCRTLFRCQYWPYHEKYDLTSQMSTQIYPRSFLERGTDERIVRIHESEQEYSIENGPIISDRYGILPFVHLYYYHPSVIPVNFIGVDLQQVPPFDEGKLLDEAKGLLPSQRPAWVRKYLHCYIDYFFDLSIVKLTYDGVDLRFRCFEDIVKRQSSVNYDYQRYLSVRVQRHERLRKNALEIVKTKAEKRLEKYRQRGIKLLPPPASMLTKDSLQLILTYLRPLDLLLLSQTCRNLRLLKNLALQRLAQWFQKRVPPSVYIAVAISNEEACFSGSSLLQALYTEEWPGTNLNVYFGSNSSWSTALMCGQDPVLLQQLTKAGYREAYVCMNSSFKDGSTVNLTSATGPTLNINSFTSGRVDQLNRYIETSFDLSIVKGSFNGSRLWLSSLNDLRERKCRVNSYNLVLWGLSERQREERLNKYAQRGFKIVKVEPQLETVIKKLKELAKLLQANSSVTSVDIIEMDAISRELRALVTNDQ